MGSRPHSVKLLTSLIARFLHYKIGKVIAVFNRFVEMLEWDKMETFFRDKVRKIAYFHGLLKGIYLVEYNNAKISSEHSQNRSVETLAAF